MSQPTRVFACTVGGSHQPILAALQVLRPVFTCFFCTDRDPATGRPGSRVQIDGRGEAVVRTNPADDRASLPAIPIQAGLPADSYEVLIVPADHFTRAARLMSEALASLEQRFPGIAIVVDYTGGTKTMTAALVAAALDNERVELQMVTGTRADLVRVASESSTVSTVDVRPIQLKRAIDAAMTNWRQHAYSAAAAALARLQPPTEDEALAGRLIRLRELSRALAAWDCFDHAQALALLDPYAPRLDENLHALLTRLRWLAGENESRREPALLQDLWHNAQRRAVQGRYDDAVGRVYRLAEWSAQWLLRERLGIDTADVPAARVPPGLEIPAAPDGTRPAGLMNAWRLLAHGLPDSPLVTWFRDRQDALRDHLLLRNHSLLAHGFQAVSSSQWQSFERFFGGDFLLALNAECRGANVPTLPPQLPCEAPE